MKIKNPKKTFTDLSIAETVTTLTYFIFLIVLDLEYKLKLPYELNIVFLYGSVTLFFAAFIICLSLIALNAECGFLKQYIVTAPLISQFVGFYPLMPQMIDGQSSGPAVYASAAILAVVRFFYLANLRKSDGPEEEAIPKPSQLKKGILWFLGIIQIFALIGLSILTAETAGIKFNNPPAAEIFSSFYAFILYILLSTLTAFLNGKWKLLPQKNSFLIPSCYLLYFTVYILANPFEIIFAVIGTVALILFGIAVIRQLIELVKMSRKGSV